MHYEFLYNLILIFIMQIKDMSRRARGSRRGLGVFRPHTPPVLKFDNFMPMMFNAIRAEAAGRGGRATRRGQQQQLQHVPWQQGLQQQHVPWQQGLQQPLLQQPPQQEEAVVLPPKGIPVVRGRSPGPRFWRPISGTRGAGGSSRGRGSRGRGRNVIDQLQVRLPSLSITKEQKLPGEEEEEEEEEQEEQVPGYSQNVDNEEVEV